MTRTSPISGGYPARGLEETVAYNGQPLVLALYPVYVIVCLIFALDALRKPGPSHRLMGELARQRARPWLFGASLALLFVSLAVGAVFSWLYQFVGDFGSLGEEIVTIAWFDLIIEALITLAVILLGQAVVAYEIFTGQALPRQGFIRQWQRAVLLALGYGFVIGFTFSTNLRPIYGVLLSALLMTFFFAMLSWRTISERQRAIASLRPFVVSQRFYDQLLTPSTRQDPDPGLQTPFNALCREVLNTRLAFLIALGPLAPLVGKPLRYSETKSEQNNEVPDLPHLSEILSQVSPETSILQVNKEVPQGIEWVVPLWSQRGLAGILLLGSKRDEGIYSQEEIEISQAVGERLIDTKASTEIAQRLMSLQRERLAETQVLDQRTRRVLHDDVLQLLHTALLRMDQAATMPNAETVEIQEMLTNVHDQISSLLRTLPGTALPQITQLGLVRALRKLVENELGNAFESVSWKMPEELLAQSEGLTDLETEVLYYAAREAIRNSAHHGRPQAASKSLNLSISLRPEDRLTLVIEDDGVGIQATQRHPANGGQGLALHSTMMAVIGGELDVETEPGKFTRVLLRLP
jgi:signal transduction histidine kinase